MSEDKKNKRRRMNIIFEVCKFRKDNKAIQCFDDDCNEIKEETIFSVKSRRRGDGSMQEKKSDTGNIIVSCEKHNWRQLFSVSQLENMPMPARSTRVSENIPNLSDVSGDKIER